MQRFRSWLNLSDSRHTHLIKNMLLISMFVFIAKIAGLGRDIAIAYEYGVSATIDKYFLVGSYVQLVPALWVGVAVSVFVPLSRRLTKTDRTIFDSQLTGILLIVSVVVMVLLLIFLPPLLEYLYAEDGPDQHGELNSLIFGLVPLAAGGMVVGLFSAQLLANEQHGNTLLEGTPALVLMLAILLWLPNADLGTLIIGSLLGMILHLLLLWLLLRRSKSAVFPTLSMTSSVWITFRYALGLMVLGKVITGFIGPVEHSIAASLGVGNITTLNYSNKLMGLVLGLGGTAISRAILPIISVNKGEDKEGDANGYRLAVQWSMLFFWLGLAAAACFWVLCPWIVSLLFERGAFTPENTALVTYATRYGLLQIPFFFSGIILVQLFVSQGLYSVILVSSILVVVTKVLSSYYFSSFMGIAGITLGTSVMYGVSLCFLIFALRYIPDRQVKSA